MSFAALDGSLHTVKTDEGELSYVVVAIVYGQVDNKGFRLTGLSSVDSMFQGNGEDAMRRMEYAQASLEQVDLVLMDRMLSRDAQLGLPANAIAVVKDFPGRERFLGREVPWMVEDPTTAPRRAFFKLRKSSWIFMTEWTKQLSAGQVFRLLRVMGNEPVPEALGYNYPLFLADKLAKFKRDKFKRTMDFLLTRRQVRYRDFRRIVESARAFGRPNR
ncbi:hypothetical protein HS1genome_1257 [Sulfodiicoccus acidiphilus]|uniref:NurA domain-containing protein n=2 Tax=Sulfodiicoccus acidiphilus TaxID=1670455 RepID=A0A348B3W6_9CREN|nr:hypothetical protein HS1genome_1257 [Sulfodiicoccus acidiphilus]GGT88368.1 hypothetical protein GCM10007116_02950 [Sulfodiicoccus acidiphilus]